MILSNRKIKKIAGISFIELLTTLLVLTIGISALIKFQTHFFYYFDVNKQQAIALDLAQKKIESLRNFEVISTTSGKTAYADIASGSSSSTVGNTTYTTTWTVTTNTNPDYKIITVQVSWTDRRGTVKNVTLTSNISKIDPAKNGVAMQP